VNGRDIDRKAFWDAKISGWETTRYRDPKLATSWLERVAGALSDSLRFRIQFAAEILAPHIPGKRVLDLGCGGGFLFSRLSTFGPARMIGIDISDVAVRDARRLAEEQGYADRAEFHAADIVSAPLPAADVVCGLGLLDWLTLDEIGVVMGKLGGAPFLFAIAERRARIDQWLHRAYVYVAYGWKSRGYVPRYYSVAEMEAVAARAGYRGLQVVRHPRLSFGALVHTL
jgi:SAM-dependent methyltransferase